MMPMISLKIPRIYSQITYGTVTNPKKVNGHQRTPTQNISNTTKYINKQGKKPQQNFYFMRNLNIES